MKSINLWTEQKTRELFQRTNIGQLVRVQCDAIFNQFE